MIDWALKCKSILEGRGKKVLENTTQQGALCSVAHTKCYSVDKIKTNVMGGEFSRYGEEKCVQGFGGEIWGK